MAGIYAVAQAYEVIMRLQMHGVRSILRYLALGLLACLIWLAAYVSLQIYLIRLPDPASGPVHEAARRDGDVTRLRQLLDQNPKLINAYGCDLDARGEASFCGTPLEYAVLGDNQEAVRLLVQRGAPVDGVTAANRMWGRLFGTRGTPILNLVHDTNDSVAIARYLIVHGADVNAADGLFRETPLYHAAEEGASHLVDLLLRNGANVDAATPNGFTSLHAAVRLKKGAAVASLLLAHHANAGARDNTGATPLHLLAETGRTYDRPEAIDRCAAVIDLLLSRGADVNARDNAGRTPLAVAQEAHNPTIVQLLAARGALP